MTPIPRVALLAAIEAAAANGPVNLLLLCSTQIEDVRKSHGPAIAERLASQFIETVGAHLRPGDVVGTPGPDRLAIVLEIPLPLAKKAAMRIYQAVRESSRFPISAGLACSDGLGANAEELCRLAEEASAAAQAEGSRGVRCRGASDELLLGAQRQDPLALSPALDARYQRVALLNQMSRELFSDKPFLVALQTACRIALALSGAKCAVVYFRNDFGKLFVFHRHGRLPPAAPGAAGGEKELVESAIRDEQIKIDTVAGFGWAAAPLSRQGPEGIVNEGAFALGYEEVPSETTELRKILLEIAFHLRNARIIQKNIEQQHTLAAVTEQSTDAILITDLQSRVVDWNPSASRLFLYEKDDMLGMSSAILVPPDKLEEQIRLEEAASAAGSVSLDTVRLKKDGSLVPVEGTYTLLRDVNGAPYRLVHVFRDITRRKEIERMKSEFVSLVSHELRTPLAAIYGFAETMNDLWDEIPVANARGYVKIILDESKRLIGLVNNFLDLSKIEAGGVELRLAPVDLRPLTARLAALFREHPSRVVMTTEIADDCRVMADEEQLYRVLVNLCANAIKYSPQDGIVTITAVRAGGEVEISVRDQGPGIDKESQARLFGRFYRVNDEISKKTPGTGLGLSICKSIVEAHKGRIWVVSAPGQGAKFVFSLPAA